MSTGKMFDESETLRQRLNEAYEKCTKIYEALAMLDERSRKEGDLLRQMVEDLQRTIRSERAENQRLANENFHFENNDRRLRQRIETIENDRNQAEKRWWKLYVGREQENYIWNHLILRRDRSAK